MAQVLLDTIVRTEYGQLDLVWSGSMGFDGDVAVHFRDQVNGLVGAGSGSCLYVHLAKRSGGSPVAIVLHGSPPEVDAAWEDVVEVSIAVPAGEAVGWRTWAADEAHALALPPGAYRVRVSASGRDAGELLEHGDEVVDRYLLELWPDPPRPDAILRTTSADAGMYHREFGGRRAG